MFKPKIYSRRTKYWITIHNSFNTNKTNRITKCSNSKIISHSNFINRNNSNLIKGFKTNNLNNSSNITRFHNTIKINLKKPESLKNIIRYL